VRADSVAGSHSHGSSFGGVAFVLGLGFADVPLAACGPRLAFRSGLAGASSAPSPRLFVQAQMRDHVLQPGVLIFQIAQPPRLVHIQTPVLRFPVVQRLIADPELRSSPGTARPASICFSTPMIRSSVYRVFSSFSCGSTLSDVTLSVAIWPAHMQLRRLRRVRCSLARPVARLT